MSKKKTHRTGIASRDEMKARTLAVARGVYKRASPHLILRSPPKRERRRASRRIEAATVSGRLSGSHVSNLSRTLRKMERHQPVTLTESDSGMLALAVRYDGSCWKGS